MDQIEDPKRDTQRLAKEQNTYKGLLRDTSFLYEDKVMELSLLRRVGDILGYILDLESFYRMFVDILLEETNAENCSFMVMDNETNKLGLKMARGRNDNGTFFDYPADSGVTFSLGEGVVGKVALAKETILIDDVSKDERFEIRETRFPIGSLLCTPLIFQEKVLGVINLSHSQPRAFGQNNKRIMELLCAFVSSIIGNATDYIKARDQEKFKAMFEGVRLSILLIDPEIDRIVDCNGYTEEWLGYSKEELVSMENAFDILPPGYREKAEQILKKIIETNSSEFNEISFIKKDGSVNTGDINGTTISYQGKNVVQVTVKDVTERKRSEERIKQLSFLKEDLLSSGSLDEKLKYITDGVVEIFDADFSRIWIMKPGDLCDSDCMHAEVKEGPHVCLHRDRCLHLMASSGRYTHIDGKVHRRVPFGCYKIGRVAAGKDPRFLTNDVTHDPRVHDQEWARKLGLVSFTGYRFLSDVRKPIGVLALFSKHAISPDEDSMLEVLANTTSQVIQTTWAEEELIKTKEHLDNTIESSLDGIVTGDSKGNIVSANEAFLKLIGYHKEEIKEMHIMELSITEKGTYESTTRESVEIDEEFFNDARKMTYEKLFKEGKIINWETYYLRKDRRIVPVEMNIAYLYDKEGNVTGSVGINRDITERKKAEKKIKEAGEFLENIFKTTADGIVVTDKEGLITMVNEATEKILGYSKEEVIGKGAGIFTPEGEEYAATTEKYLTRLFEEGIVNVFELSWLKKDGNLIDVEVNSALIKDGKGNITGSVASIRDITDRKKMELQLLQSEKLKSLGELAGGVAHDFNNVLAAILGRAQLLKMIVTPPPGKQERRKSVIELKRGLDVIEKASLDGAETVRRIQEFARRRDDDRYFTLVDMTKVIDNALEFTKLRWKNDAESKGIKIKIKKKLSILPSVSGSEAELREVIINIINNSIDAMPQGGDITIKTFKEGNHACIKVTDTGMGIPQTIGNRIFDPFFTTKGPQSSGLGMSVSYGIIHRHRGTIMIDSVEGKGSTVTIEIPFSEKIMEERKVKPISNGQKKAKILIIEDEEDVCNLLKDILTHAGHRVETASNGKRGIEKFKKKAFDMVLTDLGMPGMSGWQVAEKIKGINGKVPIVLITGWSIDLKESEMKERGIDFIIKKPYKLDQLVNIVQEGMVLRERFKAV